MKNLLFISCILVSVFAKLNAQTYNPIPFGNTKWQAMRSALMQGNKSYCFFSKDTNGYYYGGKKYWRIEFLQSPSYSNTTNGVYVFDDTLQRKIFVIDTSTNNTNLLYDFSVNPNDTVYNLYNNIDGIISIDSIVIVDSVKFITYNGISRKTVFVHGGVNSDPQVWIEGVGADNFLQPSFHPGLLEFTWYLTCQEYNNTLTFGDSIECSNFLTNSINFLSPGIDINTSLYNDNLIITNPSSLGYQVFIFNLNGKTIYSKSTKNIHETINLSIHHNSILIYRILTIDKQELSGKIFIE